MKNIRLIFATIPFIVLIVFNGCDTRKLELDRVPVPFSFVVNNDDTTALKNVTENFSMELKISDDFRGDKTKRHFTLNVAFLNGAAGELKVGGTVYSSEMEIPQGSTALTYTPSVAGKHTLIFEAKNEVGVIHKDTAYFNVAAYVSVPYTLSVTPKSFLTNNRPGTQLPIDIKVTSSDLSGTMKYTLLYNSNGQAGINFSSTVAIPSGTEIQASDNNLQLNIPASHADGTYWLALQIKDGNGDTKYDTIKYKVAANIAPTVTAITPSFNYGSNSIAVAPASVKAFLGFGPYNGGASFSNFFSIYGTCMECRNPVNVSGCRYNYVIQSYMGLSMNFNDPDGNVKAIKVTVGTDVYNFTVPGINGTYNANVDNGNIYWTRFFKSSSAGASCTTPYQYVLVNGGLYTDGSSYLYLPAIKYPTNTVVSVQVQDNEGLWSTVQSTVSPNTNYFINTLPPGAN